MYKRICIRLITVLCRFFVVIVPACLYNDIRACKCLLIWKAFGGTMANKKKYTPAKTGGVAKLIMIWVVNAYIFLMMAIYPLYYKNKYYDMCDAKWIFYRNVSAVFAVLAVIVLFWYMGCFIAGKKIKDFFKDAYKNMVFTDWLAVAYLIVCCISTIITSYKKTVIWGCDGWYMGLVAQVSFVLVYFFVSRFWRWDAINLCIFLMSAFAVFFLGVIMRFGIDPLGMYVDLDEYNISYFVSTLGQTTWYSSYMCIIFPLGLVAYWCTENRWLRIGFGMFCVMGFMTAVTQNSDSAYAALFGIFFVLFWISLESDEKFLRFLECVILALASFKIIGILQKIYAERMVKLDSLSIFVSQSTVTDVLLVVVVLIYLFMRFYVFKKTEFHITSLKIIRVVMLALIILGSIGAVVYICIHSAGKLPEKRLASGNYFVFNDNWGNNRGVSWRCSVDGYLKGNLAQKLFGVGPDNFVYYIYANYKSDFDNILGERIVQMCAHNEWLNALINVGLFGLVAYLGIFIMSFKDCMKKALNYPYLYGVALAIVAYIIHNFFCYQQIICTPTIFILMGMAQSVIRNGYADECKCQYKNVGKVENNNVGFSTYSSVA